MGGFTLIHSLSPPGDKLHKCYLARDLSQESTHVTGVTPEYI